MKRSIRALLAVLPAVAILTAATPARANEPRPLCLPVRLTGVGQDLGPDSQGNLHTTATISLGHLPIGTTNAVFTPAGPPAGNDLSFTGPIVFVARHGGATLTAQVQGNVDLSTGVFEARSRDISGTGVLSGLSGRLTLRGTENLATGTFSETIIGRLCSPLR
jgi:hypothetical protein